MTTNNNEDKLITLEEDFASFCLEVDEILSLNEMPEDLRAETVEKLFAIYSDMISKACYDMLDPEEIESANTLMYLHPEMTLTDALLQVAFAREDAPQNIRKSKDDILETIKNIYA